MAQSGFTPIALYNSPTGGNVPTSGNLVNGELAINTADGKLFYKDSGGTVQVMATASQQGTVTSVTATAPVVSTGGTTPVISIPVATAIANGYLSSTDWSTFNGKGSVSSVSFTGGIVTVATATTTPALTVAGTSGGVPYFSSASTWASSAALTQYALMVGGGAGAAPAPLAGLGTTTTVLHGDAGGVPSFSAVSLTADVSGTLPIANGGTGAATLAGASIPTYSSTDTFTNKRITPRVSASTADSATPTLNTDNFDMMVITGQTVAITSFTTNLTGTPTNGQKLWIAITGTGAIAITWGASFSSSTVTLPSTTVTTARLDIGFCWNAANSTWRCVATA